MTVRQNRGESSRPGKWFTAPSRMMGIAALLWAMSLAILASGAWLVCPHGQCGVSHLDRVGLSLANGMRSPILDLWMQGVTWVGALVVVFPVAAAGTLMMWRHRRRDAMFLVLAPLGATVLSHITKLVVQRPRPDLFPVWTSTPPDWSYPSAHTMQITALACALLLVMNQRRGLWAVVLASVAILVGWSRLYLQVHFPSDVLAGALAAALWVGGLRALMLGRTSKLSIHTVAGGSV